VNAAVLVVGGALLGALAVVFVVDPERPWAVAAVIGLVGVAVGAGAIAWQGRRRRGRRRTPGPRGALAVRRGIEMGIGVALLLWLRAVDGLSVITAAFVIVTLVVGEALLSARPQSQR
jgi:hypothetical protein